MRQGIHHSSILHTHTVSAYVAPRSGGGRDRLGIAALMKEQEASTAQVQKIREGMAQFGRSTSSSSGGGRRVVNENGSSDSEDDLAPLRHRIKGVSNLMLSSQQALLGLCVLTCSVVCV